MPEREPLLEVLIGGTTANTRCRAAQLQVDGRPVTVADYVLDDRPTHLVSTVGTFDELDARQRLSRGDQRQVAARGPDQQASSICTSPGPTRRPTQTSAPLRCARRLGTISFAHEVRRVAVGCLAGGGRPVSYFTCRPRDGALVEDDLVRGLHPMVGRRLDLWRLREFDITRLDAPEDVLLYHCIAKDNEADQRLVAMAQVRELAVVRDEDDRVTRCPRSSARSPTASRGSAGRAPLRGAAGSRST